MATRHSAETERKLDALYREPPDGFVSGRNALAKELRESGDREAAEEVKALRRPSVAAWLLNRVSLERPKDIARFADATERLQSAQSEALAGGSANKLREAAADEREQIERLVEAARELASGTDAKVNERHYEQLADTLRAGATDPELLDRMKSGRVAKEQTAATIGSIPGTAVKPRKPSKESVKDREREKAERTVRTLRAELSSAERRRAESEERVERAEQELGRAKAELREYRRAAEALARRGAKAEEQGVDRR